MAVRFWMLAHISFFLFISIFIYIMFIWGEEIIKEKGYLHFSKIRFRKGGRGGHQTCGGG